MNKIKPLVIDNIIYDSRLTEGIQKLVSKYELSVQDAAYIVKFFNMLMVHNWYELADAYVKNIIERKMVFYDIPNTTDVPAKALRLAIYHTYKDYK